MMSHGGMPSGYTMMDSQPMIGPMLPGAPPNQPHVPMPEHMAVPMMNGPGGMPPPLGPNGMIHMVSLINTHFLC